jgi:TatD DNase family protein
MRVVDMWTDTHCHLTSKSDAQLFDILSRARAQGVSRIINAGTDIATSTRGLQMAAAHAMLYTCVGVSPFDVTTLASDWYARVHGMCSHTDVVAVGEIGIDAVNDRYAPMEVQMPVFERQLQCARQFDMTAVVHSRGAEATALQRCRDLGLRRVLFHCYTGDAQTLARILDNGYDVSFSGIITFTNSQLDRMVTYVPLDRMCIETDSPYLAPHPHRGKENVPAYVARIGEKVAQLKKTDPYRVAAALEKTVNRLFFENGNVDSTQGPVER